MARSVINKNVALKFWSNFFSPYFLFCCVCQHIRNILQDSAYNRRNRDVFIWTPSFFDSNFQVTIVNNNNNNNIILLLYFFIHFTLHFLLCSSTICIRYRLWTTCLVVNHCTLPICIYLISGCTERSVK